METIIAYCGIDCSACPAYVATQKDDFEELKKVAEQWSNDSMSFKPEDIYCDGCNTGKRIFIWCSECPTKECCSGKQLENCAYCDEYICDILKKSLENNDSASKERLEEIRKNL